eukprot:scaffold1452_cov64-Phaeocystis_antarctica.AAC.6
MLREETATHATAYATGGSNPRLEQTGCSNPRLEQTGCQAGLPLTRLSLALGRALITADGHGGQQGALEVHEVHELNDGYTSR